MYSNSGGMATWSREYLLLLQNLRKGLLGLFEHNLLKPLVITGQHSQAHDDSLKVALINLRRWKIGSAQADDARHYEHGLNL